METETTPTSSSLKYEIDEILYYKQILLKGFPFIFLKNGSSYKKVNSENFEFRLNEFYKFGGKFCISPIDWPTVEFEDND